MDSQTEVERQASLREAVAQVMAESVQSVEQDHRLWAAFAEAATVETFCQSWLALQCGMIGGVRAGLVLLGPPDRGPYRPVATWPAGRRNLKHLTKTAERTLSEHRGLLVKSTADPASGEQADDCYEVSYPIEVRGILHGATVLEVPTRSDAKLKADMRSLHWGSAWLELLFSRESVTAEIAARKRGEGFGRDPRRGNRRWSRGAMGVASHVDLSTHGRFSSAIERRDRGSIERCPVAQASGGRVIRCDQLYGVGG